MYGKRVVLGNLIVRRLEVEDDAAEFTSIVNSNFGTRYAPDQFKVEKLCHFCGLVVDHEGFAIGGLLYERPTKDCVVVSLCTITPFCQGKGAEELLIDEIISRAEQNTCAFIIMHARPEEEDLIDVLHDRMFEKVGESYERFSNFKRKQLVLRYCCVSGNRLKDFYQRKPCNFEIPELN